MPDYLIKCQICNLKIAKHVCPNCGRNVCDDHYDIPSGLCVVCKRGKIFLKEDETGLKKT